MHTNAILIGKQASPIPVTRAGALRHIKQPEQILAGCRDIKKLETQADEVLRAGVGRLFKSGG